MDQFHEAYDVYTTVDAAGNHFAVRARMSNYDDDRRRDDAQRAVPPMDEGWPDDPHSPPTCIRASFKPEVRDGAFNWGAWYFMNGVQRDAGVPEPNWGDQPNAGVDLRGARELTFWAKGEHGGERVEFFALGVGWNPDAPDEKSMTGIQNDPRTGRPFQYPDRSRKVSKAATLEKHWKRYSIPLGGEDLSYVLGGFGWAANAPSNLPRSEIVFYIDDIRYELSPGAKARRLNEPRLLVSYQAGAGKDFDQTMRNTAYTYDNALALLAFLAIGDTHRAKLIADAFVRAQNNDRFRPRDERQKRMYEGSLRNAYQAGDLLTPPGWIAGGQEHTARLPVWYHKVDRTPSIVATDIRNPTRFAKLLVQSPDALSTAIRERMRPGVLEKLAGGPVCATNDESIRRQLMADELNRIGFGDLAVLIAAYPSDIERVQDVGLEDSYFASLDAGNMAWAMLALLAYHEIAGAEPDTPHLRAAIELGEWVIRNCDYGDGIGYTGGFNGFEPEPEAACYKSTEHNIDLYAAFEHLHLLTGNVVWHDRALRALRFVESMWDEKDGKFWTGTTPTGTTNDRVIPLDIQPWAVLSLGDELSPDRQTRALAYVETYMRMNDGGYDYGRRACTSSGTHCSDKKGVWYEGTAQMAAAYYARGEADKVVRILHTLRAAQNEKGALAASNQEDGLVTGFQHGDECIRYFRRPHAGATAWFILAEKGANPYWMRRRR